MRELNKLLDSLEVLKSIEIMNNLIWELSHMKNSIEQSKKYPNLKIEINGESLNYETVKNYLDREINFFEIDKEILFRRLRLIQNGYDWRTNVPSYFTSNGMLRTTR